MSPRRKSYAVSEQVTGSERDLDPIVVRFDDQPGRPPRVFDFGEFADFPNPFRHVAAAQGKRAAWCEIVSARELRGFRFLHPPLFEGKPMPEVLTRLLQLRRLVRLAVTASFIVIAALTGVRMSELLGLEEDCLEVVPLGTEATTATTACPM